MTVVRGPRAGPAASEPAGRARPILDPARAALIVIDVQQVFDAWEAAGQRRNNPDAARRVADLLAAFREAAAAVFHVRHAGGPDSAFHPDRPGYRVREEAREHGLEPVIVKHANAAFIGTDLEVRLRQGGYDQLVICGATTNHCVETTARMAGNLGFDTLLVRDACWTFDRVGPDGDHHAAEEVHAMTLANLDGEFARIVLCEEVTRALTRSAQPPD